MGSRGLSRWLRILLGVCSAVLCLPFGAAPAWADDYGDVERSIVHLWISFSSYIRYPNTAGNQVWTKNRVTVSQTCTGSFVSTDGAILTAGHCLDTEGMGDRIATKFLRDNDFTDQEIEDTLPRLAYDEIVREVLAFQPPGVNGAILDNDGIEVQVVDFKLLKDGDTALLRLNNFSQETPALRIAATRPELLARITSIGFPASVSSVSDAYRQRASFKSGEVSSFQTYKGTPFTEISAAMSGGMSGGPTINDQREIVGVNSYGPSGETQSFNFITDTDTTSAFLTSHGVALVGAQPSAAPSPIPEPDRGNSTNSWLIIVAGLGLLALGVAAVVFVMVRRNRRPVTAYYAPPAVGAAPGPLPGAPGTQPNPKAQSQQFGQWPPPGPQQSGPTQQPSPQQRPSDAPTGPWTPPPAS